LSVSAQKANPGVVTIRKERSNAAKGAKKELLESSDAIQPKANPTIPVQATCLKDETPVESQKGKSLQAKAER
jgi:hypothetical protein